MITRVHKENYSVYGVVKMHTALAREGGVDDRPVARCTVARLMRVVGLRGVNRARSPQTTVAAARETDTRPDLVDRHFSATAPNRLWVADITYIRTSNEGWVFAAFVLDVFSRRIVGWQLSRSLHTDLALDALNMAIWSRRSAGADLSQLIHHSDRGVQYVAVRYSQRLAEAEMVASVGSVGDSYDNAMAEAFNSLYKAELVRNLGPWDGKDDLETATVAYIDWYNTRRIHGELGLITPIEYETQHQAKIQASRAREA